MDHICTIELPSYLALDNICQIYFLIALEAQFVFSSFIKNNTVWASRGGIIFERIQGKVCFNYYLETFDPLLFIIIKNKCCGCEKTKMPKGFNGIKLIVTENKGHKISPNVHIT